MKKITWYEQTLHGTGGSCIVLNVFYLWFVPITMMHVLSFVKDPS